MMTANAAAIITNQPAALVIYTCVQLKLAVI